MAEQSIHVQMTNYAAQSLASFCGLCFGRQQVHRCPRYSWLEAVAARVE